MQYLDPYQIEHAKNFRYRYYPPKLVELAPPADNADHQSSGVDGGYSGSMGTTYAASSTGPSKWIWIVIITLILISCFLIIGVLMMPGPQQSTGGGRR